MEQALTQYKTAYTYYYAVTDFKSKIIIRHTDI